MIFKGNVDLGSILFIYMLFIGILVVFVKYKFVFFIEYICIE